MEELTVKNVNLFGDTVVAAQDHDGKVWAGVKWICDGLGLTDGQTRAEKKRVQEDLILQRGGTKFHPPNKWR